MFYSTIFLFNKFRLKIYIIKNGSNELGNESKNQSRKIE